MRTVLIAFLLLTADVKSELDSLVSAERAFAALSVKQGIREAFLANLSNISIIFRPGPVNGRQWFETNPARPGELSWQPEFADISSSADLGYTTGPYKLRRADSGQSAVSVGYYVTVWRREMNRQWKVALDTGVGGDMQQQQRSSNSTVAFPRIVESNVQDARPEEEVRAARMALIDAERRFPMDPKDYAKRFASDARLYRDSVVPLINQRDIQKALLQQPGTFVWRLGDTEMSRSADLGYAYGVVDFRAAGSNSGKMYNYVRIWKRERGKDWKLVLDLFSGF